MVRLAHSNEPIVLGANFIAWRWFITNQWRLSLTSWKYTSYTALTFKKHLLSPTWYLHWVLLSFLFFHSDNLYWKNDRNAFLFSLANQINTPQRLNQKDPNNPYSLYSADFYCPTFGLGHDLHVANNATGHTGSYTNINSYHKPTGTSSYNTFLAGQQHFDPSEIETFYEAI